MSSPHPKPHAYTHTLTYVFDILNFQEIERMGLIDFSLKTWSLAIASDIVEIRERNIKSVC